MTDIEVRIDDLEQRVLALEEQMRRFLCAKDEENARKEAALIDMHGEHVDKSTAARILGVTRATVYAMLADGRIEGACSGRRVAVRSIARYMATPKSRGTKTRPA